MTKFAPLTRVFWCATCKQGWHSWKQVDTPESWHMVCFIFARGVHFVFMNITMKYQNAWNQINMAAYWLLFERPLIENFHWLENNSQFFHFNTGWMNRIGLQNWIEKCLHEKRKSNLHFKIISRMNVEDKFKEWKILIYFKWISNFFLLWNLLFGILFTLQ